MTFNLSSHILFQNQLFPIKFSPGIERNPIAKHHHARILAHRLVAQNMQVPIDKIVDFGVLSCIFRRELLHCGNSLLRRLHAIATAAVARPAVGEGNGPPRVHGSKEPLAKLVAEDAANERKRPLMPPHCYSWAR